MKGITVKCYNTGVLYYRIHEPIENVFGRKVIVLENQFGAIRTFDSVEDGIDVVEITLEQFIKIPTRYALCKHVFTNLTYENRCSMLAQGIVFAMSAIIYAHKDPDVVKYLMDDKEDFTEAYKQVVKEHMNAKA